MSTTGSELFPSGEKQCVQLTYHRSPQRTPPLQLNQSSEREGRVPLNRQEACVLVQHKDRLLHALPRAGGADRGVTGTANQGTSD
jgi:hypothetical protein